MMDDYKASYVIMDCYNVTVFKISLCHLHLHRFVLLQAVGYYLINTCILIIHVNMSVTIANVLKMAYPLANTAMYFSIGNHRISI